MYLPATEIVKSAFTTASSELPAERDSSDDDGHRYIRGDPETRSPCPGLNALANQGYMYVSTL